MIVFFFSPQARATCVLQAVSQPRPDNEGGTKGASDRGKVVQTGSVPPAPFRSRGVAYGLPSSAVDLQPDGRLLDLFLQDCSVSETCDFGLKNERNSVICCNLR
jgi:hypothetical protein